MKLWISTENISGCCLTCTYLHDLHLKGKLQPFLAVAAQTLESFVRSLDEEVKSQTEDHNSQEHQFVLALAGTITSKFCTDKERGFNSNGLHPVKYDVVK